MRRKQRKFIKKNKYALFFSALLLIILAVTIVKVWPETKKAVKVINKSYVFEQYYAPISHYTDPTNSLSFDDLKAKLSSNASEEIFLGKSEKDNIKKLFGLEAYQAKVVFLNDQELIDKIAEKGNRLAIAPYQLIDSRVKTLQVDGKPVSHQPVLLTDTKPGDGYAATALFSKTSCSPQAHDVCFPRCLSLLP